MDNQENNSSWIPTNPAYDPNKPMQIGGQAVMEGVMMRAPGAVATAVRRADGSIVVKRQPFTSVTEKFAFLNVPVLRGAVGLLDMLFLGIQTLNWSGEIAMLDVQTDKERTNGHEDPGTSTQKKSGKFALLLSLSIALIIGIAVFFVTPLVITTRIFQFDQNAFMFNVTAGGIRIGILLLYLVIISFLKDIRRLFQYHGGEHKAVFAFELKDDLVPEIVQLRSRFHPRCGTSFLLIVMFVAILSFALLDLIVIKVTGTITLPMRLAIHLPFVPLIGGLSYEFIRFSARHSATWWGRILVAPGLWLQRITTKEPDNSQVEVAIIALRCALGLDDPSKYTLKPSPAPQSVTVPISGRHR